MELTRSVPGPRGGRRRARRPYEGPVEWLFPMLERAYARLESRDAPASRRSAGRPVAGRAALADAVAGAVERLAHEETLRPERLGDLPMTHWADALSEYQRRKAAAGPARAALVPGMPAVPGSNNWTPLGPSVLARGQTGSRAAVGGRVAGIAIAPGGARVYAATANGGVFRSGDGGHMFRSMMDGFDTDPTAFAATSLACGAIAIDQGDPDRVYVGTGEGDTDALFAARIVNALPSYRGIGPIRSDDGGQTWVTEPADPSLAGFAFFQIAVDPADREHCVAATTNGLYERVPTGGGFAWERRRTGIHASVRVARAGGATTWFGSAWGGPVLASADGTTWTTVGTGFPTGVGRVALGVQPDNPNVLYAYVTTPSGDLHSVQRLDGGTGAWRGITGVPAVLPGGQGAYDLCVAVDPNDANRIYLGGDYANVQPFPGSIWRCTVTAMGAGLTMTGTSIGTNAHADVHVLAHVPGSSDRLFVGTDGGLFEHPSATGAGGFVARNTGLASLCANFVAQHPTEPAVLYIGLQDNGTAKCTGDPVWRHVLFADGGYGVVNWADPFRVLLFANGSVYRATDGGLDWGSWTDVTPAGATWQLMAEPLVGTPYQPGAPAEADIVALGVGRTVYISGDFGTTWPGQPTLPTGAGSAMSMVFASPTRLYVGTTAGGVFRLDHAGATWTVTRLDDVPAGPLPLTGLVSDIAVDAADPTLGSVYVCFGGVGDPRHVWHFDGTAWTARSGTAGSGTELLDVEHNALVHDGVTGRLYVGADIGAWESADGGATWLPLESGLPDAPVYDLQIHPTARLLRAALHGRGVFEWKLDAPALPDVELYVRDTVLDTGRGVNTDGRPDPSVAPGSTVVHYRGAGIKIDVPTPAGYQTPTTDIDFLTFQEGIVDGSGGVATITPPPTVHNRVYVEVHNRGRVDAAGVRVTAVITNAATGLTLPVGFTADVVAGTPFADPKWTTLGAVTLPTVRAGLPQVAAFDLPSTTLPMPASLPGNSHYCMVVFVHAAQDPFTGAERNVDLLTLGDRKVGQRNLHIVEFVGSPPTKGIGVWAMLLVRGENLEREGMVDLVVEAQDFPGSLQFVLPPSLYPGDPAAQAKGFENGSPTVVGRWLDGYGRRAERLFHEAKYPQAQFELLRTAMEAVAGQAPLVLAGGVEAAITGLPLATRDEHAVFVRVDPPPSARPGAAFGFTVTQRDSRTGASHGASSYAVVVTKESP